jgi:hypothetical protein
MTEYRQNASPTEKLSTLLNDKRVKDASTFSQFATSDANQDAGRFEQINKANVVGSAPTIEYPRLPENSWTNDPTGVEPPLGFVDETPIVGENFEIAKSIERLERAAQQASPQSLDALPARGAAGSLDTSEVEPPPTPTHRRKPPQ